MKDNEPISPPLPRDEPGAEARVPALRASFNDLPRAVQRKMKELGVTTPEELRSTSGFMRFIEKSLDPTVIKAISDPQADPLQVLSAVQGSLNSRSAEALAIHLYTKELLRLISIAAVSQQIALARRYREPNREKQVLRTFKRHLSLRVRP